MLARYFINSKGENEITKYIESIDNLTDYIRIKAIMERIEKYGAKYLIETKEVQTKKFDEDILEIKFKKNRFMYVYIKDNSVYIFHAFRKKSQKTDKGNLNIIKKRYNKIKKELKDEV